MKTEGTIAGSGIYQIRNMINGKRYIGKSKNLRERACQHKGMLAKKCHFNDHLQKSYLKYGGDNFSFEVLEHCDVKLLPMFEQKWIDLSGKQLLYNFELQVADKHHDKNPFFGKKHTEETRKVMSAAKIGMYQVSDNPNYGNSWNEDQKDRMRGSKNTNAKLNEDKVRQIKKRLISGNKHADVALEFGVSRTVITRINSGTRWSQVI